MAHQIAAILIACLSLPAQARRGSESAHDIELDTSGCVDKDSFCRLHLDMCAHEAVQGSCTRTCCSVLTGPHVGTDYDAKQKRAIQEKMQAMGSWEGVCSAQCPVEDSEEGSLAQKVEVSAHSHADSVMEAEDALAVMKKLVEENKALKARVAELEGASAHSGGTCCAMWTNGKASELQSEVLDWCVTQTSCAKNAENPWDSYGSKVTDVVDVPDETTCKKKRALACPL